MTTVSSDKTRCKPAKDQDFLRLIAREYCQLFGKEARLLAANTLSFGERFLVNDHPDCVLEEAMPFIDVLSIQPGGVGVERPSQSGGAR